jgi:hypothetical protein
MRSEFFWGDKFCHFINEKIGKFLDKCVFPSVNSISFSIFWKNSPYFFYQEIEKEKKEKKSPSHDLFFIYIYCFPKLWLNTTEGKKTLICVFYF